MECHDMSYRFVRGLDSLFMAIPQLLGRHPAFGYISSPDTVASDHVTGVRLVD